MHRQADCICSFTYNWNVASKYYVHQSHSQNDSGDLRGVAGGDGELGCLCGKAGTSDGSARCVVNGYGCYYLLYTLLPLPLLLPIHPLHPVTSSHTPHLSRRFTSWSLTPPPRSDSVRSTVHNVRTPCRPLRTQQGGRVRGL